MRRRILTASALSFVLFAATIIGYAKRGRGAFGIRLGLQHVVIVNERVIRFCRTDALRGIAYQVIWRVPRWPLLVIFARGADPIFCYTPIPGTLHKGLCAKCGYNLEGNTSGICPECGTTTSNSR